MTITLGSYIATVVDEGPHLILSLKSLLDSGWRQWLFPEVPQEPFWFITFAVAILCWECNEPKRLQLSVPIYIWKTTLWTRDWEAAIGQDMNVVNNLTGPGIKTVYHLFGHGERPWKWVWQCSCCGGSLSGRPTMPAPQAATSLFISDPNWGVEMNCRKFQIIIEVLTLLFSGIFVLAWHLPTNLSCSGTASAGVSWDKHGQTCVGVSVWGMLRYVVHSWLIIGLVKIFALWLQVVAIF